MRSTARSCVEVVSELESARFLSNRFGAISLGGRARGRRDPSAIDSATRAKACRGQAVSVTTPKR
jgi:hypothetical protein